MKHRLPTSLLLIVGSSFGFLVSLWLISCQFHQIDQLHPRHTACERQIWEASSLGEAMAHLLLAQTWPFDTWRIMGVSYILLLLPLPRPPCRFDPAVDQMVCRGALTTTTPNGPDSSHRKVSIDLDCTLSMDKVAEERNSFQILRTVVQLYSKRVSSQHRCDQYLGELFLMHWKRHKSQLEPIMSLPVYPHAPHKDYPWASGCTTCKARQREHPKETCCRLGDCFESWSVFHSLCGYVPTPSKSPTIEEWYTKPKISTLSMEGSPELVRLALR